MAHHMCCSQVYANELDVEAQSVREAHNAIRSKRSIVVAVALSLVILVGMVAFIG